MAAVLKADLPDGVTPGVDSPIVVGVGVGVILGV